MGPPGSGKGTQAKNLAEHFGFTYFGTGDMMRNEAKHSTDFGKIFQAVWDRGQGELVSDDIVEKFVEEKIKNLDFDKGVVFDGFPRTLAQAKLMEKDFTEKNQDFRVFDIEVSNETLVGRMSTRKVCSNCGQIFFNADELGIKLCDKCGGDLYRRQEDEPEVVQRRLDVYEHETKPLIDFFNTEGKLITIDGEPSIDQVEQEIIEKINE